jgi:hypothetical protein
MADPETLVQGYVQGLYRVARENRIVLRQLMGASDGQDSGLAELATRASEHLADALGRIRKVIALSGKANRYPLDPPVTLAITAGMIISTAVFDDWLFPHGSRRISEARIIREITDMMLFGISHRPPSERK